MELLPVIVRGGLLDLRPDLLDPPLDRGRLAGPFDDRRVVLVDDHLLRPAKIVELDVLEFDAEILRDRLAAREGRDVLQDGFPTVTEPRSFHGTARERAAQLVDDQRRQRLALDLLRNDQERFAPARHLLEQRQQVLHDADLLLVNEDIGILEHALHPLGVGHEVGREIPAVELHALDDVELGVCGFRFLDGDDSVLADLLHSLRDEVADHLVVVRGDRRDLGDLLPVLGRLRELFELLDDRVHRSLDPALEPHRVGARGHVLQALAVDRLGEHGRCRRPVTGDVGSLGRDFLQHLRAHVLVLVLQLDLLGDRDPVLGDGRAAELLVDDDVAALRAERGLDGLSHDVEAPEQTRPGFLVEFQLLRHRSRPSLLENGEDVLLAHDEVLLVVQLDLGAGILPEQDPVARLDVERDLLALLGHLAVPGRDHLALLGLLLRGVRDDDPPLPDLFLFEPFDEQTIV